MAGGKGLKMGNGKRLTGRGREYNLQGSSVDKVSLLNRKKIPGYVNAHLKQR